MFIAIEGPDGVGKSTQVAALTERLKEADMSPITVSDPGTTDLGLQLRGLLLDQQDVAIDPEPQALLFLAARVQLWNEIIGPALEANQVVITDRWHLSTLIYQGMLQGQKLERLVSSVLGHRLPDVNIILIGDESQLEENVEGVDRFESGLKVGFMNYCYSCVEGLKGDEIHRFDVSVSSSETTAKAIFDKVSSILKTGSCGI